MRSQSHASLRSNDGDKTLYASFAMFQTQNQNHSWRQTFKAQALEAYSDDAVISSSPTSSALSICTRRWGCIECASTASDQCAILNRNSALNIFLYNRHVSGAYAVCPRALLCNAFGAAGTATTSCLTATSSRGSLRSTPAPASPATRCVSGRWLRAACCEEL